MGPGVARRGRRRDRAGRHGMAVARSGIGTTPPRASSLCGVWECRRAARLATVTHRPGRTDLGAYAPRRAVVGLTSRTVRTGFSSIPVAPVGRHIAGNVGERPQIALGDVFILQDNAEFNV